MGSIGKQFMQLLRGTLPLLVEADALRTASHGHFPALVVRSVTDYLLVWDSEGLTRYALDMCLTPDAQSFIMTDASKPRVDMPLDIGCGPLNAIPTLDRVMSKGFQAARAAKVATPGSVASPATATTAPRSTATPNIPPVLLLDNGQTILCATSAVQDVVRAIGAEMEVAIASANK